MAVVLSSGGHIKAGRYTDFLSQAGDASKLYQRMGTKPPRLMTAAFAGEAYGTWTFSVEFEDLEAFGASSDEFSKDPEAQEFMLRLQGESAPSTLEQVQLAQEVVLREPKGGRGQVTVVYVSRIQPGRLEQGLELGNRANAFAEKAGAATARLFALLGAGSGTGLYLSLWEFENFRAYAKAIDSFGTEPEGQAIAAESAADNPPTTLLFDAVYNEIPI